MIAIINGKIVNSWKVNPNVWLNKLKHFFNSFGDTPFAWEIFGGNAFMLKVKFPEESLFVAFIIKSIFRQIDTLDVVINIGIGEEIVSSNAVRKSQGVAIELSKFEKEEQLPKKAGLTICSTDDALNENINLLLKFALIKMNDWSVAEAEIVELCMLFPEKSQQEIAEWLRIKQSAVSQRRARSHLDVLLKLDQYFRKQILLHQ